MTTTATATRFHLTLLRPVDGPWHVHKEYTAGYLTRVQLDTELAAGARLNREHGRTIYDPQNYVLTPLDGTMPDEMNDLHAYCRMLGEGE